MNVEGTPVKRERVAPANNRWAGQPLTHATRTRRAKGRNAAYRRYLRNLQDAVSKPQAPIPRFPTLRGPHGMPLRAANGGTRRRRTKKKSN